MRCKRTFLALGLGLLVTAQEACPQTRDIFLKEECLTTTVLLVDALMDRQIQDPQHPDFGAIQCPHCNVLHTRAAEAVYPLAVAFKHTGEKKYLRSAVNLGNWLVEQQQEDGSWLETPEEWTGTTTDQLLMMVLALQILKPELSVAERDAWEATIRKAAAYLCRVMSPDFASINYCATTCASLAITHRYDPNPAYPFKAKELARQIMAKIDEDGFIQGEGDRVFRAKYGADIGYEMDMSLWGLELYARTVNDSAMHACVAASLKNHLLFVYPDGSIDGSWGIRSNKWTTFGSMTADGCQILFSLFAPEDDRYRTAAWRNLLYLRSMIKDGQIGYGPHYGLLFTERPCIYPTFARAKNLALAAELGEQKAGPVPPLPTDTGSWIKHFATMDVVVARTETFLATLSAYQYKELQKRARSKYMHRPSGGSLCNLWVQDYGLLQSSSQTEYHRWEPMHFPELGETLPLTPRIQFRDENGLFTNLYEFDGRLDYQQSHVLRISTSGELTNRDLLPGGVAYTWTHLLSDEAVEKRVDLRFHDGPRDVTIVEPIVFHPGMRFEQPDRNTVRIISPKRSFTFRLLEGDAILSMGENQDKYYAAFPSLRAYPIILRVSPREGQMSSRIRYEIRIDRDTRIP
jgi:hypothetical protein